MPRLARYTQAERASWIAPRLHELDTDGLAGAGRRDGAVEAVLLAEDDADIAWAGGAAAVEDDGAFAGPEGAAFAIGCCGLEIELGVSGIAADLVSLHGVGDRLGKGDGGEESGGEGGDAGTQAFCLTKTKAG